MLPKVSVIIPEKNEALVIEKCVSSILNSDYPKEKLELIVVCNGCSDNTEKILKKHKGKFKLVKMGPKISKGQVLNYSLKYSTGEIIGIFDADCIVEKNCISEAAKNFYDKNVDGVGGAIKSSNKNENILTRALSMEIIASSFIENIFSLIGRNVYFQGKNMFIRKSALLKLEGFNEKIPSEDFEISSRMRKARMEAVFEKKALAWQQEPNDINSYVRQRKRWALGGAILNRGSKDILSLTDLIHGFPYYASFLGLLSFLFLGIFFFWHSEIFFYFFLLLFLPVFFMEFFSKIYMKEPLSDLVFIPIFFLLGSIYIFLIPKAYIDIMLEKGFVWFTPKRSSL